MGFIIRVVIKRINLKDKDKTGKIDTNNKEHKKQNQTPTNVNEQLGLY